jgi:hypothetical protein
VENALLKYKIDNKLLWEVIDKAWKFTELPIVDKWADEIKEYIPWGILDPYEHAFEENEYISIDKAIQLKKLYNQTPKFIVEMLDEVVLIALNNLYVGFSMNAGLESLAKVIKCMRQNEVQLPDIKRFLVSKFSEKEGLGTERSREYFVI